MIQSITITNAKDESLELSLTNPWETGMAITSITGTDPVKATINTTELATIDGVQYNSARLGSRNIVFSFRLLAVPTIEQVRINAYRFFRTKGKVRIIFRTDTRNMYIDGYVESCDAQIFSKDCTLIASIICPDPAFRGFGTFDTQSTMLSGTIPKFEFEFEDNPTPSLVYSDVRSENMGNIFYKGEMPVGVKITLQLLGRVGDIRIYHDREEFYLNAAKIESRIGSQLKAGDEIVISTVKGNKYARLVRDGMPTNILNAITKDSVWFELTQGDNIIYYAIGNGQEALVQFLVENEILYEGI